MKRRGKGKISLAIDEGEGEGKANESLFPSWAPWRGAEVRASADHLEELDKNDCASNKEQSRSSLRTESEATVGENSRAVGQQTGGNNKRGVRRQRRPDFDPSYDDVCKLAVTMIRLFESWLQKNEKRGGGPMMERKEKTEKVIIELNTEEENISTSGLRERGEEAEEVEDGLEGNEKSEVDELMNGEGPSEEESSVAIQKGEEEGLVEREVQQKADVLIVDDGEAQTEATVEEGEERPKSTSSPTISLTKQSSDNPALDRPPPRRVVPNARKLQGAKKTRAGSGSQSSVSLPDDGPQKRGDLLFDVDTVLTAFMVAWAEVTDPSRADDEERVVTFLQEIGVGSRPPSRDPSNAVTSRTQGSRAGPGGHRASLFGGRRSSVGSSVAGSDGDGDAKESERVRQLATPGDGQTAVVDEAVAVPAVATWDAGWVKTPQLLGAEQPLSLLVAAEKEGGDGTETAVPTHSNEETPTEVNEATETEESDLLPSSVWGYLRRPEVIALGRTPALSTKGQARKRLRQLRRYFEGDDEMPLGLLRQRVKDVLEAPDRTLSESSVFEALLGAIEAKEAEENEAIEKESERLRQWLQDEGVDSRLAEEAVCAVMGELRGPCLTEGGEEGRKEKQANAASVAEPSPSLNESRDENAVVGDGNPSEIGTDANEKDRAEKNIDDDAVRSRLLHVVRSRTSNDAVVTVGVEDVLRELRGLHGDVLEIYNVDN